MKCALVFGIAPLLATVVAAPSQAQVAYTNAVLSGCYGYTATSVDTESPPENKNVAGTFCFDGIGHVVGVTAAPRLSGSDTNLNGTVTAASDQTGTYSVTNSPGEGMGVLKVGTCFTDAFAINALDSNDLAHGFTFAQTARSDAANCTGPKVLGGTAYYQGPYTEIFEKR